MASVWLGFVLLIATSVNIEAGRRMNKVKRCEKIAVPECANLGYVRTKFPNPFTNISTQEETNNLTRFLPVLARLNCTKTNAMPFLCSVYVPVCTMKKSTIPPCREFCEKAVGSCPALAESYGIPWPSSLLCSNYPTKRSGEQCIVRLKPRRRNVSGKKDKKMKGKGDETKCCRFGEIAANRNKSCNISDATATTQRKRFLKGLVLCKNFENKFSECCMNRAAKIQERKAGKQERKENKKAARKEKQQKKQEKKANKQKKKDERQQKRKQKKDERKQKKADRKQRKQNKKQNRKGKKEGKRG